MTMPLDVLSAGRIYCDLVFAGLDDDPAPGREAFARALTVAPGGGAHITARFAAALGLRAGLMGALPAAPFDACVRADLASHGVAAHVTAAEPGADPQITAAFVGRGDRAFVTRRPGAALVEPAALPAARHLHLGELTTALEHPGLIAQARAQGMSLSLDCGWDGAALAAPAVEDVVAAVDLFLPNADEAERLAALGRRLRPRVALVVKLGARGARATTADGAMTHAPGVRATVVDPTGAGDAFNAGFLGGWLGGRDVADCLSLGNACGAAAVARMGGAGALPPLAHLLARR